MGFTVGGTKKGRMPVTTEKRPRGKVVTLIGNVRGDKDELIKLLKHSLGCGGHAVGHQHVEIQGDHQSAIQALLLKHGGTDTMKGVEGLKEEKANEKGGQKEKEDYIDHRDLLLEKWKKTQSNVKSSNESSSQHSLPHLPVGRCWFGTMGFTVGGTKKGRMPVTTEKRPRGKVVTLIGNVRGDKDELIKLLKHSLGCGGHAVGHQHVEIQGDHQSAIQALLLKHGGTDTMKGVEGLKEEKANEKGGQKEKEDYIDHRDLLLEKWKKTQSNVKSSNHRAEESRRVKMAQATLTKRKSTREFHAFAQMMKQWRYWDQDYGRLHEMHHRHSRELDEAKNLSVGASFLDADLDDNDRLQSGPRSAVLEVMFRNLSAIESGADATTRSCSGQDSSTYSQLQKLGMVAEPSPFRQTREERVTEHRRNAVAKAKALAIAKRNGSSVGVSVAPVPKNWDPALAALEFGGYEPFEKRTDEGRVIKPSSSGGTGGSTSGSLGWAARTARTRTVPHSRGTRKAQGRGSFAKPGGHGKAGASRPTIGFTGNRKRSAAHYDHPVGFSDDGFNSEDKEEEGVARWDVQPSSRPINAAGFRSVRLKERRLPRIGLPTEQATTPATIPRWTPRSLI